MKWKETVLPKLHNHSKSVQKTDCIYNSSYLEGVSVFLITHSYYTQWINQLQFPSLTNRKVAL